MYCNSLTHFARRKAHRINIGNISIGADTPIMVQTMLSTATSDIDGSVAQVLRSVEAGAQVVRITVPSLRDVDNLKLIKEKLREVGCMVPLVADIHFNQKIAFEAAKVVEKVRINPGNFADSKKFQQLDYTETEYNAEVERVRDIFLPLLDLCKQHKTALRIGTNHGSLSDRIMSKFGDTPEGMAESAMEFIRFCDSADFKDVVVSMKASNTLVMVQATRLLVDMMNKEGFTFPIHLGVTEAGEGEDGRIKSAVGIGALLADGIGDTIRVSLTEDPEVEIPVAKKLIAGFADFDKGEQLENLTELPYNPYKFKRRKSYEVLNAGGTNPPIVIVASKGNIQGELQPDFTIANSIKKEGKPQFLECTDKKVAEEIPYISLTHMSTEDYSVPCFIHVDTTSLDNSIFDKLSSTKNKIIVLSSNRINPVADMRGAIIRLSAHGVKLPVVGKLKFACDEVEDLQLLAAAKFGALLIDGLLDGIWIENTGNITAEDVCSASFGILQASRMRVSKPDYISCPSCGRTQFNIQATTKIIRSKTAHLKGLKIGIMGCIVNGLGEMADADYGYIGGAPGKVNLYYNKDLIKRGVPEDEAVEELIGLIKTKGDWVEPN